MPSCLRMHVDIHVVSWLLMSLVTAACQAPEPRPSRPQRSFYAGLHAHERRLTREPLSYVPYQQRTAFKPTGLYFENGTLWTWSRDHGEQLGFVRRSRGWQLAGTRTGPLQAVRCRTLRRQPLTLCLGMLQKRGLRSFGRAQFASHLPDRGGFRDFAVKEQHRLIYVIDAYLDALWVVDTSGAVRSQWQLMPGAYRIGDAGDAALFVLSSNQPGISLIELDDSGMPVRQVGTTTVATVRDAVFDPSRQLLWTAGYRQARVRRNNGYIENLDSFLYAYRKSDLLAQRLEPVAAIDLAREQLCDPVRLALADNHLFAVLSGSNRLLRVELPNRLPSPPGSAQARAPGPAQIRTQASTVANMAVHTQKTGLVPRDVLVHGDSVFVAGFADNRLYVHQGPDTPIAHVIDLAGTGHSNAGHGTERSLYELGELIFYNKTLWTDSARSQFTCNSCHWDGGTDYRIHPGFEESRFELIRPAAGVGMFGPIFSPGQSPNLVTAINGFIRYLDERAWLAPRSRFWLADTAVEVAVGQRQTLSAYRVRLALLTYLARRPVEPGYLRSPGQPFSASAQRGFDIFWDDCAGCHQPTPHMVHYRRRPRSEVLAYLRDHPLAFGAPRFAKTGVEPYFTAAGNRISPLVHLARGGPYFTNGSAATLRDVLARTNPRKDEVHAPENARRPYYSRAQIGAVIDFLLSI